MISGATRGAGGSALGRHLSNAGMNEAVRAGDSRGLVSIGIEEQVAELTRLGSHAMTNASLYHVHVDPPEGQPWSEDERNRYWDMFEQEFGLERRPFASAIHVKGGREHEHRVYLRVEASGKAIRLDHDHARREKLGRVMEFGRGEPFVKGAHNRAVIAALEKEGRPEIAEAMRQAGLHEGSRPRARLTPQERQQQDRTRVSKGGVAAQVSASWAASDNGAAFSAALSEQGLALALGSRCPVIVDQTGNAHEVGRMLRMHAKATGGDAPTAAAIRNRLDGLALPTVDAARQIACAAPATPDLAQAAPVPETPAPEQAQEQASTLPSDAATELPPSGSAAAQPATEQEPGASLDDVGSGPGEPPGPAAHPDEVARYRAALAAYQARKEAAWARFVAAQAGPATSLQSGGASHGPMEQTGRAGTFVPSVNGHDGPGGGDGQADEQDHPSDPHQHERGAEPAARFDSPGDGRGTEPNLGNPDHPDRDSREPGQDGAAAGAARTENRPLLESLAVQFRLGRGLAAQPEAMQRLRLARLALDPGWRAEQDAAQRIKADERRILGVLSTHPYPDPADRDPVALANRYANRLSERARKQAGVAEKAQAAAQAALDGRTWRTRLLAAAGIATAEQRNAERLVSEAARLTALAEGPSRDDYKERRANGEAHAYAAQKSTRVWEKQPQVAAALESQRLNEAAQHAAAQGDGPIAKALEQGDPEGARAIVRQREVEAQAARDWTAQTVAAPDEPGRRGWVTLPVG